MKQLPARRFSVVEVDRRRRRRAPAPCRAARRRIGWRRRPRPGRCARRPPGSPCSPAPARAPTAGSAAVAPDLQADAVPCSSSVRAIEVDAERPLRRQRLDHADVLDRDSAANRPRDSRRRTRRDSAPTARGAGRLVGAGKRLGEAVGPGAHDRARPRSSSVARSGSGVGPPSRPMMKCTRASGAFREERIVGADVALEDLGEIVADLRAHLRCRSGRAAR